MSTLLALIRPIRCICFLAMLACLSGCSKNTHAPHFSEKDQVFAPEMPSISRLRIETAQANLLIIVADAARADHFSAFGYDRKTTPNLDRFFAESTLFSQAYAPAADTKAAISSLFTSQYPDTHGVIGRLTGLGPEAATLAECFQQAGYTTAAFSANPYLSASFGFARGFDHYDEVFRKADVMPMGVGQVDGQLLLDALTGWLHAAPKQPFFVYCHFLEPHAPYNPPQAYRKRLAPTAAVPTDDMFLYDANLLYVDDLIGRLLTTLDQLKLRDNTIVVFLADHGEAFGEHGAYHHERVAYQEMTHVPVAIRLPARLASSPQLRPEVLSPLDFMPTFLDLFQLPPPETMQGRSRLLLLAGEQENEPAFAVSRARGDDWTGGVDRPAQVNYAFRDNDNTLILGNLGQQVELYHHGKDPREQDNLAQAQPRLLKQLRRRFQQWTETQRVRPPVLKGGTLYASEARRGTMDEKTKQQLENLGYLK